MSMPTIQSGAAVACSSASGQRRTGTLLLRQPKEPPMSVLRSIALFVAAALLEIGGAWLVWQGVREHRGWAWMGAGVIALGAYGFGATLQPDPSFGRILAAYGG